MNGPTRREMAKARLRYRRDRMRRLWRVVTLRCPACPKRWGHPHKFGCSLHGKNQVVLNVTWKDK